MLMLIVIVSVPLFHVLAVHARVLAMWPAWMTFQQLCGLPATAPGATALVPIEREVPLMLRDPTALLLQFVLLLPLHLDQSEKFVAILSECNSSNLSLFCF